MFLVLVKIFQIKQHENINVKGENIMNVVHVIKSHI